LCPLAYRASQEDAAIVAKRRNLIIGAIVLVVAAAATTFVMLSLRVRPIPLRGGELMTIIISTEEIPENQLLDPLIEQGVFEEIDVPTDALVDGAVTDIEQLHGMRTTTTILAHEQISMARLGWVDPNEGSGL
jgi:hypothetical protein